MKTAVDSIAESALAGGPIAGMSVAVLIGDDLVVNRGYGLADVENGIPADSASVYNLASVTKLFTAAAVLKLVESTDLDLDARLSTLLPSFPNQEQADQITLRHLLSHTSGLHDYEDADTERWLSEGTPLTPGFVLDYLRDRPLDFEPGSAFAYSNTGFYLLGLILEQNAGVDFGTYIRQEIALPLGLAHTYLCDESLRPENETRGYEVSGGELVPGRLYTAPGILGDGGLCSTAGDLVRLPGALQSGGVLTEASLAQMLRPTVLSGGVSVDYGLGTRLGALDGRRVWGHTGGMGTYWAILAVYPEDSVTIAVLVNTDNSGEDALTIEGDIARAVLDLGRPVLQDLALSPKEMGRFTGFYEGGPAGIRIYESEGYLFHARENGRGDPRKLLYQGSGVFGWGDYPMDRLVFHVEGDRALGLSEYYNGMFAAFLRAAER